MSHAFDQFLASGGHAQVQAASSGLGAIVGGQPTLASYVGETVADNLVNVSGQSHDKNGNPNGPVANAMLESLKAAGTDEPKRKQMEETFFKVTLHNMKKATPEEQQTIIKAAEGLDKTYGGMGNIDRRPAPLAVSAADGAKKYFDALNDYNSATDPERQSKDATQATKAFEEFKIATHDVVKAAYQKKQLSPAIDPSLPNQKPANTAQQR